MNEGEYLHQITGSNLGDSVNACTDLNDTLTKSYDSWFGPDEVDSFDASCNTCKHFERKPMTPEEKRERTLYGMPGTCTLKDKPTRALHRGIYCGFENRECYENRRTGMRPLEACKRSNH